MYKAVLEVCKSHETSWAGIPGFVSKVNELEMHLKELTEFANQQSSRTVGVSATKYEKINTVVEHLLIVQAALEMHGKNTGDHELRFRNKVSKSSIRRLSMPRLTVHLNNAVTDLNSFSSALGPYGVTEDFVIETILIIEEAIASTNKPRMAIIERKLFTRQMNEHARIIDELISFHLDKMIRVFKKNIPSFYDLYFNARKVLSNSHKKPNSEI